MHISFFGMCSREGEMANKQVNASVGKTLANCSNLGSLAPVCTEEQREAFHSLGFSVCQSWVSAAWGQSLFTGCVCGPVLHAFGGDGDTAGAQRTENPSFRRLRPMPSQLPQRGSVVPSSRDSEKHFLGSSIPSLRIWGKEVLS